LRPHRLTTPAVRRVCALAAAGCLALVPVAPAGAMPYDNERPPAPPARHVVTPTVVKETIVRPTADIPVITLLLAGGGVVVAMFGAGYLGARMTRHPGL
jgi:hypothetical protein